MVYGSLGAPDGVDAAVHHAHPHAVPGDVEGSSLTPLVGHGVVAAQSAGIHVALNRQVSSSHLNLNRKKQLIRFKVLKSVGSERDVNPQICV